MQRPIPCSSTYLRVEAFSNLGRGRIVVLGHHSDRGSVRELRTSDVDGNRRRPWVGSQSSVDGRREGILVSLLGAALLSRGRPDGLLSPDADDGGDCTTDNCSDEGLLVEKIPDGANGGGSSIDGLDVDTHASDELDYTVSLCTGGDGLAEALEVAALKLQRASTVFHVAGHQGAGIDVSRAVVDIRALVDWSAGSAWGESTRFSGNVRTRVVPLLNGDTGPHALADLLPLDLATIVVLDIAVADGSNLG